MDVIADNIGPMLKVISTSLERRANGILRPYDLTLRQMQVMIYCCQSGRSDCPLKELEQMFSVSQATMQGIVARLEEKKLLESVPDLEDKRIKKMRLSEEGRMLCEILLPKFIETQQWVLEQMTEEEQTEFIRILRKLYESVR